MSATSNLIAALREAAQSGNLTEQDREAIRAIINKDDSLLRVTVSFGAYNPRRYSRPWVARVSSWPVGGQPALDFGVFIGDAKNGGVAELAARTGDIVRWGQKDQRGSNTPRYGIVQKDGSIAECSGEEAREAYGKG